MIKTSVQDVLNVLDLLDLLNSHEIETLKNEQLKKEKCHFNALEDLMLFKNLISSTEDAVLLHILVDSEVSHVFIIM